MAALSVQLDAGGTADGLNGWPGGNFYPSASVAAGAIFAAARRILLGVATGTTVTIVFLAVCVVAPLLNIGYSPVLAGSMRPAFAPAVLLITA